MSPNDLARLQASLDAAGDAIVAAHEIIEAQNLLEDNVLVDFGSSLDAWHSLSSYMGTMGPGGKTTLVTAWICEPPVEKPMVEFIEHAVIGYLMNGDAVGLAKLNAAFPTEAESLQINPIERSDAGIYAESVLALNGRSLDSHNPWHMEMSFENFLESEIANASEVENPQRIGRAEITAKKAAALPLAGRNKVAAGNTEAPRVRAQQPASV